MRDAIIRAGKHGGFRVPYPRTRPKAKPQDVDGDDDDDVVDDDDDDDDVW